MNDKIRIYCTVRFLCEEINDRGVEVGDHSKCYVGEGSTDVVHDYCL